MKTFFMGMLLIISTVTFAQPTDAKKETKSSKGANESLGKIIDNITYAWDLESDNLDDYPGMIKFCTNREYRLEVITLLHDIHHYDSVLLERLQKASRFNKNNKELEKTLKDIEKFEKEFSMKAFIKFLFEECQGIQELEKAKKDIIDDIADESYDGKRYVLETEVAKYIHHITKRVDTIREHVHHLHIE